TGGFVDVATDDGVLRCRLRGKLKKEARRTDLCVAGDYVEALPIADGREDEGSQGQGGEARGTIERILPRDSRISRVRPARSGPPREDVLVANVDQLMICVAFGDPPLRP